MVTPRECAFIKVGVLVIFLLVCCYMLLYSLDFSVKFVPQILLT